MSLACDAVANIIWVVCDRRHGSIVFHEWFSSHVTRFHERHRGGADLTIFYGNKRGRRTRKCFGQIGIDGSEITHFILVEAVLFLINVGCI